MRKLVLGLAAFLTLFPIGAPAQQKKEAPPANPDRYSRRYLEREQRVFGSFLTETEYEIRYAQERKTNKQWALAERNLLRGNVLMAAVNLAMGGHPQKIAKLETSILYSRERVQKELTDKFFTSVRDRYSKLETILYGFTEDFERDARAAGYVPRLLEEWRQKKNDPEMQKKLKDMIEGTGESGSEKAPSDSDIMNTLKGGSSTSNPPGGGSLPGAGGTPVGSVFFTDTATGNKYASVKQPDGSYVVQVRDQNGNVLRSFNLPSSLATPGATWTDADGNTFTNENGTIVVRDKNGNVINRFPSPWGAGTAVAGAPGAGNAGTPTTPPGEKKYIDSATGSVIGSSTDSATGVRQVFGAEWGGLDWKDDRLGPKFETVYVGGKGNDLKSERQHYKVRKFDTGKNAYIVSEDFGDTREWDFDIAPVPGSDGGFRIVNNKSAFAFTIKEWRVTNPGGQATPTPGDKKDFTVKLSGQGSYKIEAHGTTEWGSPFIATRSITNQ